MKTIAILLTCHNRREKTISCLKSLYKSTLPEGYQFDVYLVDDGSTDGTRESIETLFPEVNVIVGNGNLFWAGGMRLAWNTAIKVKEYDAYILINDDVILEQDFINKLIKTENYSIEKTRKKGIYAGATFDNQKKGKITYGGVRIIRNHFILKTQKIYPNEFPQVCDMTNANILWVSREVVNKIGIFDEKYTHGIADYDYSRLAIENKIPVLLSPGIGGYCSDDHGVNWKTSNTKLKERISYLRSPKGLAYHEYLYYIKKHFPLFLPYTFVMLWLKTLFPFFWEYFKNKSNEK